MNIQESQLVIRDTPLGLRVFSVIIIAISLLVFFEIGKNGFPILIFTLIGMITPLLVSNLTITADRSAQTLRLEYRSPLKYTLKEIPFAEIANIHVQRSARRSRGWTRYVYRIVVTLRDGEVVPFRSYHSSGSSEKEKEASALRAFIGLGWPPGTGSPW